MKLQLNLTVDIKKPGRDDLVFYTPDVEPMSLRSIGFEVSS